MTTLRSLAPLCCIALLAVACGDDDTAAPGGGGNPPPGGDYTYDLVDAFPNLTFNHPVDVRNAGDGSNRLFVVEQAGVIRVFANTDTVATTKVYLDISAAVASGGELGLLGLAFHPDYASNGYFFVYYTIGTSGNRHARLCRFQVSADPDAADPSSETLLIDVAEPFDNHNGGGMCFDGNGYLCLGIGDGGDQGDPNSNGQNPLNLLGTVLRIDVDQNVNGYPYYGIPADNPFVGGSLGRHEVFAYGFRNPWRVSWDAVGGKLWVGDVGQGEYEEIDNVTNGGNYGWDCREGSHPYTGPGSPAASCGSATGLIDPIFEYSHSVGNSITGGYVYRGPTLTSLSGRYVFADYVQGKVWALTGTLPLQAELLKDTPDYISTFGVDEAGELLVAKYSTSSKLFHITQTEKQN